MKLKLVPLLLLSVVALPAAYNYDCNGCSLHLSGTGWYTPTYL